MKEFEVKKMILELERTALDCISYVGSANYQSRENDARKTLLEKADNLYKKAERIDEINSELLEALKQSLLFIKYGSTTNEVEKNKIVEEAQSIINKALGL